MLVFLIFVPFFPCPQRQVLGMLTRPWLPLPSFFACHVWCGWDASPLVVLCLLSLPVMYDVGELPVPLLCYALLPSLFWTSALPVTAKTAELKLRLFLVVVDKVKFSFSILLLKLVGSRLLWLSNVNLCRCLFVPLHPDVDPGGVPPHVHGAGLRSVWGPWTCCYLWTDMSSLLWWVYEHSFVLITLGKCFIFYWVNLLWFTPQNVLPPQKTKKQQQHTQQTNPKTQMLIPLVGYMFWCQLVCFVIKTCWQWQNLHSSCFLFCIKLWEVSLCPALMKLKK